MSLFNASFDDQVEFLRQKTDLPSERWDDIWQEAHDQAFIVAGAQTADLLADLHAAVDRAIADGNGLEAFRKDFYRLVARHGWTGWTGEGSPAGIAWRTKVIYETNLSTAYAAARWQQLHDSDLVKVMPYLRYKHADGVMYPRPLHVAWDGLTLPREHPFWRTHYPPNGWGCHCRAVRAYRDEATEEPEGWRTVDPKTGTPLGIDKGWDYNVGQTYLEKGHEVLEQALARLPLAVADGIRREIRKLLEDETERA